MACPEVQPPAYRVPKPINKPPSNKIENPFGVCSASSLKIASGYNLPLGASIPSVCN